MGLNRDAQPSWVATASRITVMSEKPATTFGSRSAAAKAAQSISSRVRCAP